MKGKAASRILIFLWKDNVPFRCMVGNYGHQIYVLIFALYYVLMFYFNATVKDHL